MREILPVFVMNRLLRSTTQRSKLQRWVRQIENYPNWLGASQRELLVETRHGFTLWCDRSDYIGRTIIDTGEWEPLVSRTIQACLQDSAFAIDVGANIGYDTLLMSKSVGPAGQVLAFEPNIDNLGRLIRNLQQSRAGNVCVQSTALSDGAGWGTMSLDGEYGHANLRNDGGSQRTQKILTLDLDTLLTLDAGRRIQLVKMDVEGFEYKVLQGMQGWLERVDNIICEVQLQFLERCGASAQGLFELMHEHGFTAWCAEPESDGRWVRGDHRFRPAKTYTSGMIGFDTLFCRKLTPPLHALVSGVDTPPAP